MVELRCRVGKLVRIARSIKYRVIRASLAGPPGGWGRGSKQNNLSNFDDKIISTVVVAETSVSD